MKSQHCLVAKADCGRRSLLITCLSMAVLLGGSTAVWAHHSYAMFDMKNPVEVKGTVKLFRFTNPHSWIVLSVEDKEGKAVDYKIATGGPFNLARKLGWKRDSFKPGDVIVALVHPLRDGSPGGDLIKATFSDGHEMVARPPNGPLSQPEEESK